MIQVFTSRIKEAGSTPGGRYDSLGWISIYRSDGGGSQTMSNGDGSGEELRDASQDFLPQAPRYEKEIKNEVRKDWSYRVSEPLSLRCGREDPLSCQGGMGLHPPVQTLERANGPTTTLPHLLQLRPTIRRGQRRANVQGLPEPRVNYVLGKYGSVRCREPGRYRSQERPCDKMSHVLTELWQS